MAFSKHLFRIPRPKTFLFFMSLRTGTSLATLTLLLNKVSGLYGLLAILTGFHLSPTQLSMYIYSVLALCLSAYLAPHIRTQSPLHCLALAWIHVFDTVINAAYTAVFAVTWFLVISSHHKGGEGSLAETPGAGGAMINDTAGFTNPKYNVSHVEVAPAPGAPLAGQDTVVVGSSSDIPAGMSSSAIPGSPSLGHGFLQPESVSSVVVICALWAVRVYFMFIVLSYARFVVRQHIAGSSRSHVPGAESPFAENPFAPYTAEGQGWKGRIGRMMVSVGKSYWLGQDEDETWMGEIGVGTKRERKDHGQAPGLIERERRRRSGTGPPPTPAQLVAGSGQHLRVQEGNDGRGRGTKK